MQPYSMRQFTTRPRPYILDLIKPKHLPRLPTISSFHCSGPAAALFQVSGRAAFQKRMSFQGGAYRTKGEVQLQSRHL